MFDSVTIGMSGLQAFQRGLKVISNNVANLNTPGFKSADLLFADLYYQGAGSGSAGPQSGEPQIGTGVSTLSTYINFKDGETRQTGNPLDMSVDGLGFFVTRDEKDGSLTYTRAGQFEFDKEGILRSRNSQRQVLGYGTDGVLGSIALNGLRVNAPSATTRVRFGGNLSSTASSHSISPVNVIDGTGAQHTLTVRLSPKAGESGTWTVTVVDGSTQDEAGEIRFSDGNPVSGADRVSYSYTPAGADPIDISLDFSDQVTSFASGSSSTLSVSSADGAVAGTLTQISFDAKGVLTLKYSNGNTATGAQLALARFDNNLGLEAAGSGEFVSRAEQSAHLDRAGAAGYGSIASNQVEVSNVDLAAEFSNLIVMQRGYQASSRIVSTANEMLQELFDMKGKR